MVGCVLASASIERDLGSVRPRNIQSLTHTTSGRAERKTTTVSMLLAARACALLNTRVWGSRHGEEEDGKHTKQP